MSLVAIYIANGPSADQGVRRAQGVVDFDTQLLDLGSTEISVTSHQKTASAKGLLRQQKSSDSQSAFFDSYSQKLFFPSHLRMNCACSSTLLPFLYVISLSTGSSVQSLSRV